MKKGISLLLIGILLLAGCQKTPEKEVVIQKDLEQMLDTANKDEDEEDGKSLTERYDIPLGYKFSAQGADGKLNIEVDAQVVVPNANTMPIYRVQPAAFSKEQVRELFQYFCGNADMWATPAEITKGTYQNMILSLKKEMADFGSDMPPEMEKESLAQIKEWEEAAKTAPESVKETKVDAAGISEKGLHAREKTDTGEGRFFDYYTNKSQSAIVYADMRTPSGITNFGSTGSAPIFRDTDVSADVLAVLGVTPSEAKQTIQKILDTCNIDMMVDSVYLQDDEQTGNYDGRVRPAQRYAYSVYCVRVVDHIPCVSLIGASSGSDENDRTAPMWEYERMEFKINQDGVFSMLWMAPVDVSECVNTDAQMKPFSEIQEIFEKMMRIKYEAKAELQAYDFKINRAVLSLHRISEQNASHRGLLIPAWNFYGQCMIGDGDSVFEEIGVSYLSINAIDGTIIDVNNGY